MDSHIYQALQENPIIAAIRDNAGLEACLHADVSMVFVLYGDVCSIPHIVETIKKAGKMAVVHVDLIVGLAAKEVAVDYIRDYTDADGIISTRPSMVQRAKELHMFAVLREFLIDSMALSEILGQRNLKADALDILPGIMPTMIRRVRMETGMPVFAGGLITTKQDVMQALEAGALAISTTDPTVWSM